MKKLIIPAALLLIVACAQPFLKDKDNSQIAIATTNYSPPVQQENTRHPYKETFSALNIPDEMRQNFRINPKTSQVIVGESGTMILIPDNAFADANGNEVEGKVKMEIVEGIKNADILKMNLGTMSDQGPLETGGMIYVNAFSESGDTLQLAKGKQLDVEIPTDNKKREMKLWSGITNEDGSVSWTDPQPLKEELQQIPVSALEEKAETGTKVEKPAVPAIFGDQIARKGDMRIVNSAWVVNGVWISGIRNMSGTSNDTSIVLATSANGKTVEAINLTDKKYESTNIATTEFRSRLPFIRQACDTRIMLCYTDFPTRALWKSDKAAADTLEKSACPLAEVFRSFAELKQGKINPSDPNTVAALNEARDKAIKNYSRNVKAQQRKMDSLCAAFSSYSFGLQKLGWANIDRLASGGTPMFLNAHIDGAPQNVEVKLIVPSRNLFIPGYRRPNGDYAFTHGEYEQNASYPEGGEAYILARSGQGENLRFDLKKIIFGQNKIEKLSLHAGTEKELMLAMGNEPVKKDEPEKEIDDWYTKALRSGGGCLCDGNTRFFEAMK